MQFQRQSVRVGRQKDPGATPALPVTATVLTQRTDVGRFVVEGLSAGGALLRGRGWVDPDESVRVALPLPGRAPLVLDALVLACAIVEDETIAGDATAGQDGAPQVLLEVTFLHRSPRTEDAIQDALLAALSRQAAQPTVLFVSEADDGDLGAMLSELGRRVELVRAPLDAIRLLEAPDVRVEAAFIDDAATSPELVELVAFLRDEHPTVLRVAVGGGGAQRDDAAALVGAAHARLDAEADREAVARVFDVILA